MHVVDATAIKEEASSKTRSVYIALSQEVLINGKVVHIKGGIKSLQPPCKEEALSSGKHPYTCENCFLQLRELQDTIRHRKSGSLDGKLNRLGLRGFNKRYARNDEAIDSLEIETQRRRIAEARLKQMVKVTLTQKDWEERLHDSCINGEDQRLVIDLVRLLKMDISQSNPIQLMVIRNLVSKLQKTNNHRYVDLVKDISGLFKNELGPTNYSLLAEIFGLARETTAAKHSIQLRLDPGLNLDSIDQAALTFKGLPVNEASDGARCLRYLEPRKQKDGEVVLVGHVWNPDVSTWHDQNICIPRRDSKQHDQDDFEALKRLTDKLIKDEKLAKTVSVHNLTPLASMERSTVINCMWPCPDRGYKAKHLLKYWEALRKACYYDSSGAVRKIPLNLVGYSTDSAGFSLAAAIQLMTPTEEEIKEGVLYLGLGIDEEEFVSPYYWYLPSIAYLDYDHEQRLFLKNLKYETRDLTLWEDGKTTILATIKHLQDLKHRCQDLGLDCGFSATDLLLIYFCDQNSDACQRIFTTRIADLLDKYVPGSRGTSLYIRAVYRLIEPFRAPNFGSPEDVQKSVSCGITIFRLWRKVLELKKMLLHSKPNAKIDPTKRGKFVTYGCYKTAEILFTAATVHQLAMFLHFKDLGPSWASPFNSGTKSTERIIGEMQGKTTELQSLDAQPTFRNMLDRSSKVQFNQNAKQRLAASGANVKASNKRKKLAFAFQENKHVGNYVYPAVYSEFKEAQVKAHREGVEEGQVLFATYLPQACVELLKETGNWKKPYCFSKPKGYTVVDGPPSKDFNKLDTSFAKVSIPDLESKCCEETDEVQTTREEVENRSEDNDRRFIDSVDEDDVNLKGGKNWKISKYVDGTLTYIHVSQAIKILLPREYVSRCRQKRHWASKYLPGKEPLNPSHDIFKYCDVALMVTQKGKRLYHIGRVEAMESTRDGSEVTSFELKRKTPMRIRCSLYCCRERDLYCVSEDSLLTNWKSQASIITKVELQPVSGESTRYTLHPASKAHLVKLGILPFNDLHDNSPDSSPSLVKEDSQSCPSSEIDDDFYEVEDVLERRLSKDSLCYEYKVRFKGYGSDQDMWLPSSFFNRAFQFESTSKFGRKRKHNLDPENVPEDKNQKRKRHWNSNSEVNGSSSGGADLKKGVDSESKNRTNVENVDSQRSKRRDPMNMSETQDRKKARNSNVKRSVSGNTGLRSDTECKSGKTKKSVSVNSRSFKGRAALSQQSKNQAPTMKAKKKAKGSKDKGKAFRSSLHRSTTGNDVSGTSEPSWSYSTTRKEKTETNTGQNEKSVMRESERLPGIQLTGTVKGSSSVEVINVDDFSSDKEASMGARGIVNDLMRRDDNFKYPRRILGETTFPEVDDTLRTYEKENSTDCTLTDPLGVEKLPPLSIIHEIEGEFRNKPDLVVKFPLYGNFDREGVRILKRFHRLKGLRKEVQFEKKWLQNTFSATDPMIQEEVTHALLDRWNIEGSYLATYGNYRITSQELSLLCGERYLSDEILNFLVEKYCDKSNEEKQVEENILLPSFLSTGDVLRNVVERICLRKDMGLVTNMFLPVHINMCHWGLAVFSVVEQTVFFDDGYHCPIPNNLKSNAVKILNIIYECTGSDKYKPSNWTDIKRFVIPMPDQPENTTRSTNGFGSCGVAVICSVRDICNDSTAAFTWSYHDAPSLRAELMMDVLDILH